jgi:Leucine-rich repeat (LRR) protein
MRAKGKGPVRATVPLPAAPAPAPAPASGPAPARADVDGALLAKGFGASGSEMILELPGEGLGSMAGLSAAPSSVRSVNLAFNNIARVEGLQGLPDLRELKLYDNQLTEVSGLER